MASAAEQLVANINLGAFAKATELERRMLFTVGMLIVYRLGTYVPIPGVDPLVVQTSPGRIEALSWGCTTSSGALRRGPRA